MNGLAALIAPLPGAPARAADWSVRVSALAEVVEDVADINQCIAIILTTPLGSDPHRPDFGWNGDRYLDLPPARALPHLVREAMLAVLRWEPRVIVESVKPEMIEGHHWQISVVWRYRLASDTATATATVTR